MNIKKIFFLFGVNLLNILFLAAQTPAKIEPEHIIGTAISVDYDNNSTASTTVNTKENVFDDDLNTYFASYDRSNTWVGLDLQQKYVITKVAYCPRSSWPQRLTLGVFEGANSPDFGDAVPIYMITEQPAENRMTEQAVNNSRGFRYVRYVGPHDMRCNIAELAFYGYPGEGDDSKLHQLTNLPDVIIHTVDAQNITSKKDYVKGIVSFISEAGAVFYSDSLDIRGRGNASWGFEKKPYRIKLAQKTKLLGNPANARNWTLINNWGDKTLMRNLLAFDISERLEMAYTPAGQPVNVFLNGEFKGCYQLCDHIDVRKHRVDITEMETNDISDENLTGGYLVEIDAYADGEANWFRSNRNTPVTVKSPDSEAIVSEQNNYIKNYFNQWEASIWASNFSSANGFRKYMDTKSFVRHFLVGELSGNTDTYWSVYMYKQRGDDLFYFGPVWDFDLAFENDNRTYPVCGANGTSDWIFKRGSCAGDVRSLVNRLLSDTQLMQEIRDTWAYYRDKNIISETQLLEVVDGYADEIDASQKLNFMRWNILNQRVHQNNKPAGSYAGEVEVVRKYIKDRLAWFDKKLNYIPGVAIDEINLTSVRIGTSEQSIRITGLTETVFVEIFNPVGKVVYRKNINNDTVVSLAKGVYIVRVSLENRAIRTIKCVVS
ncbi:hypothetical protein AGMMS50262_15820 [Bacteroidia bacterium]|nr:hypothetical protein AGMMS50262_15820 [Bacteroidia bacterium]